MGWFEKRLGPIVYNDRPIVNVASVVPDYGGRYQTRPHGRIFAEIRSETYPLYEHTMKNRPHTPDGYVGQWNIMDEEPIRWEFIGELAPDVEALELRTEEDPKGMPPASKQST